MKALLTGIFLLGACAAHAGVLGVGLQDMTPTLAEALGAPEEGILVRGVEPGSPAEEGGLLSGDVIVELNKKKVLGMDAFVKQLRAIPEGKSVALTVWRSGTGIYYVGVRLGPNKKDADPSQDKDWEDDTSPESEPTPKTGKKKPPKNQPKNQPPTEDEPSWRSPRSTPPQEQSPSSRRSDSFPAAPEDPNNLVKNGGFESGLTLPWGSGQWSEGLSWRNVEGNRATADADFENTYTGEYSLRIEHLSQNREGWMGGTSQKLGALAAGKTYRLQVWAMGEEVRPDAFRVRLVSRNNGKPFAELVLSEGTYGWEKLKVEFEAPEDSLDLEILSSDKGLVFLDDVSLKQLP